ncbi:MAG: phosphoglycerate kinase, partial [Woeseiaceae bacterium]|nr:phosphoglycerate kinase [Woeseiaceae bacterium]
MSVIKMTDVDLSGKRVLIREDLNVTVADGKVTSDARIRAALPTITAALASGAAVMLMSHLGRPVEGVFEEKFSLKPVADRLSELLDREVPLKYDWITSGPIKLKPGELVLLENVRFHEGEKACDEN